MKRIVGLIFLAILLTGCAPAGSPQPAAATEQVLPTPEAALSLPMSATATLPGMPELAAPEEPAAALIFYPPETRLDIQTVDDVLEGILTGNRQALSELLYFTPEACTVNDGLGGPPKCAEGEADGTVVGGFMILGNEGLALREADREIIIDSLLYGKPALYTVIEAPNEIIMEEDWLPAQYAVIFVDQLDSFASAVLVDKNGILRVVTGRTLADLFGLVNGGVILPPLDN